MLRLEGRLAYVTGASQGIGWAVARSLAGQGAHVVLGGRDASLLEARSKELKAAHGQPADFLVADVANAAEIRAAFAALFRRHRRLDILVNNAGVLGDARLGMISDETIEHTFAVNAHAAILHLQSAVRLMQRSGAGSIINISSIIGLQGNAGQCVYAASKAALVGLTLAAAKELAPLKIRVNAVAPGYIATRMVEHLEPKVHAERLASIKMGRVGQPEDVANAVLFFASGLSAYVTGQVLGVDGGMVVG